MYDICEQCFNESEDIRKFIVEKGIKQHSSFTCKECNREDSEYLLPRNELKYKLQYIISSIYEHEHEHGLHGSAMMADIDSSSFLSDLYNVCYNLFEIDEPKLIDLICENNLNESYFLCPYEEVWIDIRCDWEGTIHHDLEWENFCNLVKYKARFFDHESSNRLNTLNKLKNLFDRFTQNISNKTLFRARKIRNSKSLENIIENPSFCLGKVPNKLAGYNRFSPAGISYIYLADNQITAAKEIRSKVNDEIAMGEFILNNDLKIIEFSYELLNKIANDFFDDNFCPEVRATSTYLNEFIEEISKPIAEDDKLIDYVPTQIVSEFIWSLGYNGFTFPSSFSTGVNFVLFEETYRFVNWERLKVDSSFELSRIILETS